MPLVAVLDTVEDGRAALWRGSSTACGADVAAPSGGGVPACFAALCAAAVRLPACLADASVSLESVGLSMLSPLSHASAGVHGVVVPSSGDVSGAVVGVSAPVEPSLNATDGRLRGRGVLVVVGAGAARAPPTGRGRFRGAACGRAGQCCFVWRTRCCWVKKRASHAGHPKEGVRSGTCDCMWRLR